jgi:hypothetical protein
MVLDILGRSRHPKIELRFWIEVIHKRSMFELGTRTPQTVYLLKINAKNKSRTYAQFVNTFVLIPGPLAPDMDVHIRSYEGSLIEHDGMTFCSYYHENTARDVLELGLGGANKYGPARFDPILPELSRTWDIDLHEDFERLRLTRDDFRIEWSAYADNAPKETGFVLVRDVDIVDRRR